MKVAVVLGTRPEKVGAHIRILDLGSEKAAGRAFNVATGAPTSINRLAQLIIDLFEANGIKPKHRKARVGDVRYSYADIREAKARLGFEPEISLKEGLSTLLHAG